MKLKLRARLLVAFFLLITIPCGILGFLSYRQASHVLQDTIEGQLQDSVQSTAEFVEAAIYTTQKVMEAASAEHDLTGAAATGMPGTAPGVLKAIQENNKDSMEDVFVADRSGKVVAISSNTPLFSVGDRSYFSQAIAGQPVVSNLVTSRVSNKAVVVVAQPLRQDGQIVGVLAATIDFTSLAKKVGAIKVGETGYGYMIDKTGLIVYHPNQDMVLKENLLQNKEEKIRAMAQKMVSGQAGKDIYTLEGVEKLAAYAPAGPFIVAMTVPVNEYMAPARAILYNTIIIVLVAVAVALAIALAVANSIVKPVKHLRELMAAAGEGDLTVVSGAHTQDEIGDLSKSFDIMIKHQNMIVKEVRAASTNLAASSEQMAASSEQVTSTSQEIAGSMQVVTSEAEKGNASMLEASQALVHLSSLVQIAKNKASGAASNSQTTYGAAEEGRGKVTQTVAKMRSIKEQTEKSSNIIAELDDYSRQIGQIVNTITAIAAQTDLLALNAAIESARAGEHGRGFAVVAEEVRKLAEQSNQGAQEITALIRRVTDKTQEAVIAMSGNVSEVEAGVVTVTEAGSALDKIIEAVNQTVKEISGINEITEEEVASSEQIIKLIDRLASVVEAVATHCQQVAAGTEEQSAAMETVTASSEETSASANQLKSLVEKFKV